MKLANLSHLFRGKKHGVVEYGLISGVPKA